MPLVKSTSNRARRTNIKREIDAGKPIRQAVAIGYSEQRRAHAKAGHKTERLDRDKVSKWSKGQRKDYQ
jgi:hypothetical protein